MMWVFCQSVTCARCVNRGSGVWLFRTRVPVAGQTGRTSCVVSTSHVSARGYIYSTLSSIMRAHLDHINTLLTSRVAFALLRCPTFSLLCPEIGHSGQVAKPVCKRIPTPPRGIPALGGRSNPTLHVERQDGSPRGTPLAPASIYFTRERARG